MTIDDKVLQQIKLSVEAIRFGSVEIVIHDSQVVQIERKEKVRFTKPTDRTTGSTNIRQESE